MTDKDGAVRLAGDFAGFERQRVTAVRDGLLDGIGHIVLAIQMTMAACIDAAIGMDFRRAAAIDCLECPRRMDGSNQRLDAEARFDERGRRLRYLRSPSFSISDR